MTTSPHDWPLFGELGKENIKTESAAKRAAADVVSRLEMKTVKLSEAEVIERDWIGLAEAGGRRREVKHGDNPVITERF